MSTPTPTTKPSLLQRAGITRRGLLVFAPLAIVALLVGYAAGGSSAPEPVAAPEPEVETVTETIEITNPNCRDAATGLHDLLQQQTNITAEVSSAAADAMSAAASYDTAGLNAATERVLALNERQENMTTRYTTEVAPLYESCLMG